MLIGGEHGRPRLWEVATGRNVAELMSFRDGTWAVVDADGHYDSSNGGDIQWLQWVDGLDVIQLEQVKEQYYEPGLLTRSLGSN